jgi:ADP-ribose pyrophosphatase
VATGSAPQCVYSTWNAQAARPSAPGYHQSQRKKGEDQMPKAEKVKPADSAEAKTVKSSDKKKKTAAAGKPSAQPKAAAAKSEKSKVAKAKTAKSKPSKSKTKAKKTAAASVVAEKATLLSSEVVFEGPLFRVLHDKLIEPGGYSSERDIIRHNGSVVILAVDNSSGKKNPWIVMERQYRHAANQFMWELPAGKLEPGEDPLAGAQRELSEETGYIAKKWKPLVEYFASPGFLGESMKVFLAEGLVVGEAHPEEDEKIEIRLVKLNDVLKMIDKGMILDGKTMTSVMLYARRHAGKNGR